MPAITTLPTGRRALALVLTLTLAGLATALVLQHAFDMRPCAWCVAQRVVYLAIALLATVGLMTGGLARHVAAVLVGVGAMTGVGLAAWQHFVAAEAGSCGFAWPARKIYEWRLDEFAPWLFQANASCAEANVPLLGVPFALWSMALFVALEALAILTLRRT